MRLGDFPVEVLPGTIAYGLYKQQKIVERHRHRYEVDPAYISQLEGAGLIFSGRNQNRMEIAEIEDHPFFFTTQFHPEFKSRPTRPSPPFLGFVEACLKNRGKGE